MTLTVGSVCSGIAAPETAWASLGWDFLWSADIEPFPNGVRAARFQGVPNLGDMTAIAARVMAGEVAAPDVLVGGTPCQSFSVAGLRKGLADDRGNLALEFIRLADAIDVVRRATGKPPCFVLWENVPGVLSDGGNAFGAFLAGLVGSDAPLVPRGRWTDAGVVSGPGRCAAWRILDAQFYGLAQRRERVFVLARGGAGAWAVADALLPVIPRVRWHPAPRREAREAVALPLAAGLAGGSGYRNDADTADNLVTAWGGNNTSGAIDVAAALNACPTAAGRQDFESETFLIDVAPTLTANGKAAGSATQQDAETGMLIAHTLRAEGFDASEDGTGRGTPLVAVAATLSAGGHPNSAAPGRRREDDHNLVAEPLPFDTTQITSKANRSNPKAGDPCHPLAAGAHPPAVAGMAVRRLTPRECERLQGFPDDWTQVQNRGKPAADGPRYRAIGNSMAVPVLAWIGRQIQSVQ
jgi:DNA (cytosine-5)-methyltransferase 1